MEQPFPHWLIRWDEHGAPRGEHCTCQLGTDHDELGYFVDLVELSVLG